MDVLLPGKDLGKYRVVRRLATGGMAEIYLAEARGIEGFAKHVVLKCILPQYAQSETFVRLFLNEARLTASLDHPNIASVYDIGTHEGTYFFAMEYIHGEDLGHMLRALFERQASLPLEDALTIGAGVAAGLHAAHEKCGVDGNALGIVHRDVSPSNVVVTYDGGVKLVDFGVAKLTAKSELTNTGTIKGKLSYMSPEQCGDEPLDRRSDVFSLGVLLYELTTLTRLFRAESEAATLRLVLETTIPPPSLRVPGYPPELEAVLKKALARNRNDRFATAREFQLAIEDVARRRGLVMSAARLGEWMTDFFGRRPEPWVAAAGSGDHAATPALPAPEDDVPGGIATPPPVLDRGPQLAPLPLDDGDSPRDRTPGPAEVTVPRKLMGRTWPLVAVAAAGLALGLFLRPQREPAPPPIIAGPAAAAPTPATLPAMVAPPAQAAASPAPAAPTAVATPPSPPAVAPKRPAARKPPNTAPEDRFRTAFARKQNALLDCFARFDDPSAESPAISIRFQADEDGHVVHTELSPTAVAETPLGECLEGVARETEFGPQGAAVTFRIPVSVRRLGSATER